MDTQLEGDLAALRSQLQRIEARQQIQQLPARYAMAIDARDMDALSRLYVPDVDCGKRGRGRDLLRSHFEVATANFYRSVHQIVGHVFDLEDEVHASGRVYCRAEHEYGDKWIVAALCYFDKYACVNGEWLFSNREVDFFYCADHLERPQEVDFSRWATPEMRFSPPMMLPRFPHWRDFWAGHGEEKVNALTSHP